MRTADDLNSVELDDDTLDRLDVFAAATGQTPGEAAAALLRDLLRDCEFWREAASGLIH